MNKICLVLEGGGNRGVFTAGVLDAFLDYEIYINNIYAVSAGALNAMSYLSRQKGRSFRINKDHVFSDKCINYKRVLHSKGILNLDYLFNEVNTKEDPFDLQEFNKNKDNYVVVSTNVLTGAPFYKKIEDYSKDWEYIKASASLPLFSKLVAIESLKLTDGGISDSIPIVKALNDGYDRIIVVTTRDKDFICKPYRLMNAYKTKYFKYPKLIEAMKNRYNKYNVTRDLIVKYQQEGKVLAIYPSEPLIISNLERDEDKLVSIYNLGYNCAKNMIDDIKMFIGGNLDE